MDLTFPVETAERKVVFGKPCPRHANEAPFERPYRKQYALLISASGATLGLAKLALDEAGDALIEREATWLRELEEVRELRGQVPRLFEQGQHGDGRRYLITSVSPVSDATEELTRAHARFLAHLGKVRFRVSDFELSGCCETLQRSLRRLEPFASAQALATLQAAYHDCETALLYWTGPYVVSQGDFAPWNIRAVDGRLYVFDWENARANASPLDDVLHYLIMPRILQRNAISIGLLQAAMRQARDFALDAYPEWAWRERVVAALTLVYLLGAVVRHSIACGRIDFRHPMINAYWRLIERRSAWMPSDSLNS